VAVFGGDSDIGTVRAGLLEGAAFTTTGPGTDPWSVSLGANAQQCLLDVDIFEVVVRQNEIALVSSRAKFCILNPASDQRFVTEIDQHGMVLIVEPAGRRHGNCGLEAKWLCR
jgi:hypothetical protein